MIYHTYMNIYEGDKFVILRIFQVNVKLKKRILQETKKIADVGRNGNFHIEIIFHDIY